MTVVYKYVKTGLLGNISRSFQALWDLPDLGVATQRFPMTFYSVMGQWDSPVLVMVRLGVYNREGTHPYKFINYSA